jgi:hypothetical protein
MRRPRPSIGAVIVLVMVGLGLVAFAAFRLLSPSAWADRAHDRAVERWEAHEPVGYSFDFSRCSGMCSRCVLHVTVEGGRVVRAAGDPGCGSDQVDRAPTIEGVFALEEQDRAGNLADSWEISYDPTWGYPQSVEIRCPDGYSDCGTSSTVTGFEAEP